MRRDPAITFRGALQILGHHDRPWLDRLDSLLGGVVLGSVGVPPISALFELVDQKNEATGLIRRACAAVSDRLLRTGGLERHQLVIAAHTTIAVSALFDTIDRIYPDAAISDAEKLGLVTRQWDHSGEPLIRHLYDAAVPAPSLTDGFHENVANILDWAEHTLQDINSFLHGLKVTAFADTSEVLASVEGAYRSSFLTLAATVTEFKVWSDLGEHAATRSALARMESLLGAGTALPARDLRQTLRDLNRAELSRPVIEVNEDGYGTGAAFPSVGDIFITPRFRATRAHPLAQFASETWWKPLPVSADLDLALARHFLTEDALRRPLLLLGHPGAGKSLLMKVLAARLPEHHTVIRIPLRRVDANVHVSQQISQGLSQATHGAVQWSALAEQSSNSLRVVILDGLDELLQATTTDRASYLTDLVEFQRVEAALGHPVAVVVTSRVLVADHIRIPEGTPVVKIEEFDKPQITLWVEAWNAHNPQRSLPVEVALDHLNLAAQPLLLLMLSLYFTDPATTVERDLSQTDLYTRLFDTYARREVTKQRGHVPREEELTEAVEAQITRLAIAALGMFNRGRQSISEAELISDLRTLQEEVPDGTRVLGEFFFVHSAEALTDVVHRSYEFLHLTFAEYLVARHVVEVLRDTAASVHGRRKRQAPDDELLYALLSHQVLTAQRPVYEFAEDLLHALGEDEAADVVEVLEQLIPVRRAPETKFGEYQPLGADHIRAAAAYSANLLLLRVAFGNAHAARLWPDADPDTRWLSLVNLWAAGLEPTAYNSLHHAVRHHIDGLRDTRLNVEDLEFRGHNRERTLLTTASLALHDRFQSATSEEVVLGGQIRLLLGYPNVKILRRMDPHRFQPKAAETLAEFACFVLAVRGGQWSPKFATDFLLWLLKFPAPSTIDDDTLIAILLRCSTALHHAKAALSQADPRWERLCDAALRHSSPQRDEVQLYLDRIAVRFPGELISKPPRWPEPPA
ncbi:AAA family ATPase [Actinokineospora sp. PR83]|uniref:NACHT domain-containing protein n=1 Tax=Actinokineospora sp. PR83 TaxID=2884908 RepID=UPI0027DED0B0|nr:AAA family ATPase [Actinokineospora sp. PR83]MCG8914466.1 AAA family ATPase [Actinokineospora sp. PR83]